MTTILFILFAGLAIGCAIGDGLAAQSALQRDFADRRVHCSRFSLRDAGSSVHRRRAGDCLRRRHHGAGDLCDHAAQRRRRGASSQTTEVSRADSDWPGSNTDRRNGIHSLFGADAAPAAFPGTFPTLD